MSLSDTCFFIPARAGSKGFPHKNRILFERTAEIIPSSMKGRVYVSTDDAVVFEKAKDYGFNAYWRSPHLCTDEASVKDVLVDFADRVGSQYKNVILLYLTYPERTWEDIERAYKKFLSNSSDSLICCEEVNEHPYLMVYEKFNKIVPVVKHELYRRQDYPKCYRMSLFVAIYRINILNELNDLLYNDGTSLFHLEQTKIDVDYEKDYMESVL